MKKIICLILCFLMVSCADSSTIDLDCNLSIKGSELIFENKDDFVYENVEVKINKKYIWKKDFMYPYMPITIQLREFSDEDGNRFTNKASKSISVFCNLTEQGKNGYFYGEL